MDFNGVTRPKKYSELSATEAIQADYDIKATNIILQGLPPEVYALVSNHKFAKELWERIQLLMQGTSLTKKERECKLYDEFDKFAYKKGETLREFYLRFSRLLNDMNIYNMKLEQFQVNTKFLNALPPDGANFKGRHLSITCALKPKRKRDDLWFKDKVLLVQAQVNGQILHEEELAFRRSWNCKDALAELKKAQQLVPKLYDGNVIKNTSAIVIPDFEKTLMLAEESHPTLSSRPTKVEVPKELLKVSMVNTSLKKLKHHLAGFDVVVKERTTDTAITEGSWGFEYTKACFRDEIIPFVISLKDLFNTFDQFLIDELSEVQNVFHQMEQAMEQHL
ncbi:hypothetical protein Tco_1428206 [Tanacetum coccineum]